MFMHGEPRFFFEEKLLFKSFCHSYLTHQVTSGDLVFPGTTPVV